MLLSSLLAGCSATNPNILKTYDAASSSRVRIFVYSADRIRLDFDRQCYTTPGMFGHGEGLEAIQRGRFESSRSVGMPPTLKSSDLVFDEFVIKAGVAVTVFGKVGGTYVTPLNGGGTRRTHYGPESRDAGYFVPEAGKDYEIYVTNREPVVEDVSSRKSGDTPRFVHLTPAKACDATGR